MRAAKAFLSRVSEIGDGIRARVISDGLTSYPKAIKEVFGKDVKHTVVPCTANKIEQDHRPIKARYYPMAGFFNFRAARRFCATFEEVRQVLRIRSFPNQIVSLSQRRNHLAHAITKLYNTFVACA